MSISITETKHWKFTDDQKPERKFLDHPKDITDALDRIEEKHYQDFLWLDALAQAHGKIYDEMAAMRVGRITPKECAKRLWDAARKIEGDHPTKTDMEVAMMFQRDFTYNQARNKV